VFIGTHIKSLLGREGSTNCIPHYPGNKGLISRPHLRTAFITPLWRNQSSNATFEEFSLWNGTQLFLVCFCL